MNRDNRWQSILHRSRVWLRAMLLVGCPLLGLVLSSGLAHAGGVPGGNIANPVVRAVDIAKPAVVRIITTLNAHLTVHFNDVESASFPQNGPDYKLRLSGSGAFISAHGDILTADHVVRPPHDQSLDQYLYEKASQDIADYLNTHFPNTAPYSANDVLNALSSGVFRSENHYAQASSEVFLSTDYSGPINAPSLETLPAALHAPVERILAESSFDTGDIALIHINMSDTPSITLGDSSNVEQQDDLTIIGYPGNGDVSERKSPRTVLTSSVNRIYVSSLKQTDAGTTVIQVGGNVEHGDSGGPALDSSGNIVGVVSFGLFTSDGGGGTTFLQESNTARNLITSLKLDTRPGPFTKAWRQAFSDYSATTPGHWHAAQHDFQVLAAHYSNFQAVTPFLDYTEMQASHEKLPQATPAPTTVPLFVFALLALLVMLGGVVLVLLVWRKRRAGATVRAGQHYSNGSTTARAAYMGGQMAFPAAYGTPAAVVTTPPSYEVTTMQTPGWSYDTPATTNPSPYSLGSQGQPMTPVVHPEQTLRRSRYEQARATRELQGGEGAIFRLDPNARRAVTGEQQPYRPLAMTRPDLVVVPKRPGVKSEGQIEITRPDLVVAPKEAVVEEDESQTPTGKLTRAPRSDRP